MGEPARHNRLTGQYPPAICICESGAGSLEKGRRGTKRRNPIYGQCLRGGLQEPLLIPPPTCGSAYERGMSCASALIAADGFVRRIQSGLGSAIRREPHANTAARITGPLRTIYRTAPARRWRPPICQLSISNDVGQD